MTDMQSKSPHFDPGDLVTDRENDDEDDDPRMLVVDVTDDRADEVEVAQTGSTVADYNPEYPADDPVISIVFVEDELGLWKKDADLKAGRNPDTPFGELITDAVPDDRRRYSYPQSRLIGAEYQNGDPWEGAGE